jgi:hypothetical protein
VEPAAPLDEERVLARETVGTLRNSAKRIELMAKKNKESNPSETEAETLTRGAPVRDFPIQFEWWSGRWQRIFQCNVELIQRDLALAMAEDRVIVYLSCPISSRGGGNFRTNVDIANFTARRLMSEWGERFFILNPAAYQLESREGTGIILDHIRREFGIEDPAKAEALLAELRQKFPPQGGDYMRMWTCVLVTDGYMRDADVPDAKKRSGLNCGGVFDAYYFVGPSDMHRFFGAASTKSLTAAVEEYFARKYTTDPDFRDDFEVIRTKAGRRSPDLNAPQDRAEWELRRKSFFRYYAVRAAAAYSLGSHDEWNIFVRLNARRLNEHRAAYGAGEQIAGFYDGRQLDPVAAEREVSRGYEPADSASKSRTDAAVLANAPGLPGAPHPREMAKAPR